MFATLSWGCSVNSWCGFCTGQGVRQSWPAIITPQPAVPGTALVGFPPRQIAPDGGCRIGRQAGGIGGFADA